MGKNVRAKQRRRQAKQEARRQRVKRQGSADRPPSRGAPLHAGGIGALTGRERGEQALGEGDPCPCCGKPVHWERVSREELERGAAG
jgi:hypothetical protein